MLNSFLLLAEAVVYFSVMVTHARPFRVSIGKPGHSMRASWIAIIPLAQKASRASAPEVMPLIATPVA